MYLMMLTIEMITATVLIAHNILALCQNLIHILNPSIKAVVNQIIHMLSAVKSSPTVSQSGTNMLEPVYWLGASKSAQNAHHSNHSSRGI
ncbi:hypothetical protein D0962_34295 [Leptolyngbyaceae cyanobacterium CCMR0082]|uniref:Uncharacterized protein n=2 Tax=Adonisia turfae TaxID=2950184 RepID=A0A6M0SIH3_9CYAN|nr:hypothetical protein [Adonisia turfae CCMR0081]NEZ67771.1 hypothetical protein [Adonisia turfae CCMR0082]